MKRTACGLNGLLSDSRSIRYQLSLCSPQARPLPLARSVPSAPRLKQPQALSSQTEPGRNSPLPLRPGHQHGGFWHSSQAHRDCNDGLSQPMPVPVPTCRARRHRSIQAKHGQPHRAPSHITIGARCKPITGRQPGPHSNGPTLPP